LTRLGGGGATVAKTAQALIIGVWIKDKIIKDIAKGKELSTNAGACTLRVKHVAKVLSGGATASPAAGSSGG
jgi:hypothetical protein